MWIFSNQHNEELAKQYLKIIQESMKIVNTTKKPDIYFDRYILLEEKATLLSQLHGLRFTGQNPVDMLQQIHNKKQDNIRDMITRYFDDITSNANSLKTDSAKRNKYQLFITTLEDYYSLMSEKNIEYVKALYENAISHISN